MESRKKRWIIDLFTILVMMATVILLCHPIGRDWTEEEIDRYVGTDGVYSPDVDTYYYLRKAKEFSRGGIGSITLVVNREEDPMCTTGDAIAREANGAMPMLLPASAALTWYGLRAIGIDVSIYDVTIRFCSFLLSLFVIPVYLF
jgi:asparagine N-glycosylation enzyme membrane subunit Stt3